MRGLVLTPKEIGESFANQLEQMRGGDAAEVIHYVTTLRTNGRTFANTSRKLRAILDDAIKSNPDFKAVDIDNPEKTKWYYMISLAVEDGMLLFATRMIRHIRYQFEEAPKVEADYIEAATLEIEQQVLGTNEVRALQSLNSAIGRIEEIEATPAQIMDCLCEGMDAKATEMIREQCEKNAKADIGWAGTNPRDMWLGLSGNVSEFCDLCATVAHKWGEKMLARLATEVYEDHELPAAWALLRIIWSKAVGDDRYDTSTIDAYLQEVIPDNVHVQEPEVADPVPVVNVPEGHVILAPNMMLPSGMSGERRRILTDFRFIREPIELLEPKVSVSELRERMLAEFPWMERPIDLICKDLDLRQSYGQREYNLPPLLIHGRPGTGKTRFVQRLGKVLGIPSDMLSLAGASDDRMLRGTGFGWSSANPSYPVNKIVETRVANPLLIFDEVDKSQADGRNGDPIQTLLMMTERENAAGYFDECLMCGVNLSYVNFFATANEVEHLSMPFLSRFRVVETPPPEPEHVRAIMQGVRADFADEVGVDVRFIPEMDEPEIMFLEGIFAKYKNVRSVIRMTQKLLDRRERIQRATPN